MSFRLFYSFVLSSVAFIHYFVSFTHSFFRLFHSVVLSAFSFCRSFISFIISALWCFSPLSFFRSFVRSFVRSFGSLLLSTKRKTGDVRLRIKIFAFIDDDYSQDYQQLTNLQSYGKLNTEIESESQFLKVNLIQMTT